MKLEIDNLSVHFRSKPTPALSGISLTIPAGSFTVLVGPSGSGKSTLLQCLAGFQQPTTGVVTDSAGPVRRPDARRGMVFQRDVLFPWTTIGRNIAFGLRAAGVPRSEHHDRVAELLAAVELPADVSSRRPHELSGGMRQRAGIARMLAGGPEVMLMDEPFAALDAQTRINMQDLVIDLWHRFNRTVVFVTHDVDEAIRLSQQVIVLRDGHLHAVLDNPLPMPRPAATLANFEGYADLRLRLHQELGHRPVPIA